MGNKNNKNLATAMIGIFAVLGLMTAIVVPTQTALAQSTNDDSRLVWLTTRSSSAQETFSNNNLDGGDIIVYHFGLNRDPTSQELQDLNDVTSVSDSRKGLEFFSLPEIQEHAPTVAAQGFGFISYDLENGNSPSSEVSNPVASIQTAKEYADAAGINLMVAPSNAISTNNADDIAAILDSGDRYHLQSQPRQDDDADCTDMIEWINARITEIEGANDDLAGEITAQVTLTGNAASGKTAYQTAQDCIDAAITTQGTVINGHADGLSIFWGGASWDDGSYEDLVQYFEANYS